MTSLKGDLSVTNRIISNRRVDEGLHNHGAITSNITLDLNSASWQVANPTTADRDVNLPNATTLPNGWQVTVENTGTTYHLSLKNNGGTQLSYIEHNSAIIATLVDNSTSNGIWYIEDLHNEFENIAPVLATYGGQANVGRYLEIFNGQDSLTAPILIPATAMIVALTMQADAIATATIGIFKTTDLVNPLVSISLTAQTKNKSLNLAVNIPADTELAIRVTSVTGTLNKPKIAMYISGA